MSNQLSLAVRIITALVLATVAAPSWAAMWSTRGSPNAGSYTISWNTNTAGCTWEDIYPPYGWYIQICNWLEEKAGSGVWTTASTSGNSMSFS